MESHFRSVYRELRSKLKEPDKALFILHTNIGAITLARMHYEPESGYVFLEGKDEQSKPRFVGFSEQQLSTFALEAKFKSTGKEQSIGFALDEGEKV